MRFHTIIWPIMLMAMGEELPKQVYGHGWLVVEMCIRDRAQKAAISAINYLAKRDGLIETFKEYS